MKIFLTLAFILIATPCYSATITLTLSDQAVTAFNLNSGKTTKQDKEAYVKSELEDYFWDKVEVIKYRAEEVTAETKVKGEMNTLRGR